MFSVGCKGFVVATKYEVCCGLQIQRAQHRESNRPRQDNIRSYADLNAAGEAHVFDRAKVDEFYYDIYQQHQNSEQDNQAASGYVRAEYNKFKFTQLTYGQNERSGANTDSLFEERFVNIVGLPGDCVSCS